jgi:phage terminase small subunit
MEVKLINTEKIVTKIIKNKDKPKKVTKTWIMETYELSKAEATKVKYAYDEKEMAKKIGKQNKKESEDVEDIFSNVTEQEKIFCLEYLKSYNLRNAAVKAGYSPHTGARLIKRPSITSALKAYQDKREEDLFLSGIDIIRMYVGIAFADITDYVDFGSESVPMLDGYGKEIYDKDGNLKMYTRSYVRLKDSAKIDGRFIQEVKSGKDGVSVKLFDKIAALDKIAKVYDIYSEENIKKELLSAKLDVEKAKAKVLDVGEDSEINISVIRKSEKKKVDK